MNQLFTRLSAAPQRLVHSARRMIGRLHRDESGATLTEFVIMLPIFILIFNGVMVLGQFTRKGSEAPIRAYQKTFDKAIPYQKSFFRAGWNSHASTAAGHAGDQLAGTGFISDTSPAHNRSPAIKYAAIAAETATYGAMVQKGHMGESYMRTQMIDVVPGAQIKGCEGIGPSPSSDCTRLDSGGADRLTQDLKDIVGESKYAYQLLNDGPDVSELKKGTGVFGTLNNFVTAAGIRPAFAAGIRYGTVSGNHTETYDFAGRSMEMSAFFSTLLPPGTTGGGQGPRLDAGRATATTRLTMQGRDHYSDLIGIGWSQPLSKESISVPSYP